ncbi:MAG: ABC-type sugar transport system, periplasmic component [Haloquadratum sp. J07HQX50]|jgi:ABC-type sugar transport system, periplasmic component|nr:MAG: ABC-type sugar transport system, periplasmic component [Haloquadratum sp. J07HQX50]
MSENVHRRRFLQASAISGATLLAGCSGQSGDGTESQQESESESESETETSSPSMDESALPTAALSIPSLEFTFFARMENAFNQAISDGLIAEESTFYDSGNSQSAQISDVETAVSNDVDFLIISAITAEGVINAIEEANAAEIPVIAIDRNVAAGETVTYVASDNVRLGERSTELCLEFMQEQSDAESYNILQLEGTPGASVTNDRGQGFQNVVNDSDNLTRLASQTGEFSTQQGLSVMEDFITQYGDEIDGVFCQNDLMGLGVHQALQNSNLDVPVTGIDGTEAWVNRFSDNEFYGTIAQLPEKMVTESISQAKAHMAGEDVDDTIPIEGLRVTQENGGDYLDQYF